MGHDPENYAADLDVRISALLSLVDRDLTGAKILDFGCQHGTVVESMRNHGYDAYGFDVGEPTSTGTIRKAPLSAYTIPWPDSSFDLVFSHHVFEHVFNPREALSEIR